MTRYKEWLKLKLRKKKNERSKKCIFHTDSFFDELTVFEGRNLLAERAVLLESSIGFASYIGKDSKLNKVKIGKYTCIGPNVENILGKHPVHQFVAMHPCFYSLLEQCGFTYAKEQLFEEYVYSDFENKIINEIGNDVWIGQNALLMQGVKVGDGAIVAAGALVLKDVPPYSIVGGIPAKVIGWRFEKENIEFLMNLKWWEQDEAWIKKYASYFSDIEHLRRHLENK